MVRERVVSLDLVLSGGPVRLHLWHGGRGSVCWRPRGGFFAFARVILTVTPSHTRAR